MHKKDIEQVLRDAIAFANTRDAEKAEQRAKNSDWYTRDRREAARLHSMLSYLSGACGRDFDTSMISAFQKAVIDGTNPLLDAPAAEQPKE